MARFQPLKPYLFALMTAVALSSALLLLANRENKAAASREQRRAVAGEQWAAELAAAAADRKKRDAADQREREAQDRRDERQAVRDARRRRQERRGAQATTPKRGRARTMPQRSDLPSEQEPRSPSDDSSASSAPTYPAPQGPALTRKRAYAALRAERFGEGGIWCERINSARLDCTTTELVNGGKCFPTLIVTQQQGIRSPQIRAKRDPYGRALITC